MCVDISTTKSTAQSTETFAISALENDGTGCPSTSGARGFRFAILGRTWETVELRDLKGRRVIGQGQFHDRSERYVPDPPPPIKDDVDFGELLMKLKDRPTAGPIDPKPRKQWDLGTFVTRLCELTGDDIGTMSEEDLQVMANAHRNNPSLTMKQLRNVYQRCSPKNYPPFLSNFVRKIMNIFESFGLKTNPFSESIDPGAVLEDARFHCALDPLVVCQRSEPSQP